jgi:maltose O-acetyltransferase
MSIYQSMLEGGPYLAPDPECGVRAAFVAEKLRAFNAISRHDREARQGLLKDMLLSYEPGMIVGPLTLEYGHLMLEAGVYINWDCMFVDNARITLRKNVMIGPRCLFVTASHSLDPMQRAQFDADGVARGGKGFTAPITVEDHVWIGAHVTVLPGVTIGARSTIGAGSVVTRDVPPGALAFGNPCRVQREI